MQRVEAHRALHEVDRLGGISAVGQQDGEAGVGHIGVQLECVPEFRQRFVAPIMPVQDPRVFRMGLREEWIVRDGLAAERQRAIFPAAFSPTAPQSSSNPHRTDRVFLRDGPRTQAAGDLSRPVRSVVPNAADGTR